MEETFAGRELSLEDLDGVAGGVGREDCEDTFMYDFLADFKAEGLGQEDVIGWFRNFNGGCEFSEEDIKELRAFMDMYWDSM